MKTEFYTTAELIELEDQMDREGIYHNRTPPLALSVIPNQMGINLCSVEGMSWTRQDDGQLVNLSIHFKPRRFIDEYAAIEAFAKHGLEPTVQVDGGFLTFPIDQLKIPVNQTDDEYYLQVVDGVVVARYSKHQVVWSQR